MRWLLFALGMMASMVFGGGCTGVFGLRQPSYYEAQRAPTVWLSPSAKAYFVDGTWYAHERGRWRRHLEVVVVTYGRDYIRIE